jgi:hypothetical protein
MFIFYWQSVITLTRQGVNIMEMTLVNSFGVRIGTIILNPQLVDTFHAVLDARNSVEVNPLDVRTSDLVYGLSREYQCARKMGFVGDYAAYIALAQSLFVDSIAFGFDGIDFCSRGCFLASLADLVMQTVHAGHLDNGLDTCQLEDWH